jgi:2-polyprenyl-6-hydroxyphenyl methylase/3-demethylubiquinone-9 3-methyltransferase
MNSQIALSDRFDRVFLPREYRIDGCAAFAPEFIMPSLYPGATVVDVGGGKWPAVSAAQKSSLELTIVGFDISKGELDAAPPGIYDSTIYSDVTQFVGEEKADIVICSALLEHVPDVDKALWAIASMLRSGGLALVFVPSRNAAYARLNLLLPQSFKKRLLDSLFPEWAPKVLGFPVYYDHCTPRKFKHLAEKNGLRIEKEQLYFCSAYFMLFTPLHILWRIWQVFFRALVDGEAAETFSLALRKCERKDIGSTPDFKLIAQS